MFLVKMLRNKWEKLVEKECRTRGSFCWNYEDEYSVRFTLKPSLFETMYMEYVIIEFNVEMDKTAFLLKYGEYVV